MPFPKRYSFQNLSELKPSIGFTRLMVIGLPLLLIGFYRYCLSPFWGQNCRYLPTCSQYCMESLLKHGLFYGGILGVKRLLRCHPWGGSGVDPVPEVLRTER